jgi:integrase/recombinase XerD
MTSLRRRMIEDMQVRNLSSQTQATYVQQVSLFARHFNKSPEILGPEEIRSYQVYLTNEKKLAPSSIIIAIAALRFLYKITLHKDWRLEEIIPTPKKPQKLPIVPSPKEVQKFFGLCAQYQASHHFDDLLRVRNRRPSPIYARDSYRRPGAATPMVARGFRAGPRSG